MRTPIALLASVALLTSTAQVDINKMIQERMQQQGQSGSDSGALGMNMVDDNDPFVPNEFTGSFRMEMHFFKGDVEQKHSPSNMHYTSSTDMTLMRVESPEQPGQQMQILTDLKDKWTYTLMSDNKGKKMAMKSRKKKFVLDESASGTKKEPVITVTKETKLIEGHTCTKVVVVSEEGTWTGWVAKDVKAPFTDMARNASQGGNDEYMRNAKGMDGMPLEFEWVPTDGKDRMVIYVRDLQVGMVDASAFSLDGYQVMEMPSFGR